MIFILSSISSGLEFWSINHTSMYENSWSKVFKNIKFLGRICNNSWIMLFNLMSRTNETRHIEWHEICKCKCRLAPSVCNNKQHWNDDKCRCECKRINW